MASPAERLTERPAQALSPLIFTRCNKLAFGNRSIGTLQPAAAAFRAESAQSAVQIAHLLFMDCGTQNRHSVLTDAVCLAGEAFKFDSLSQVWGPPAASSPPP